MSLITRLNSQADDFADRLKTLLAFDASEDESIEQSTATILQRVRQHGDSAVLDYTRHFDGVNATAMVDLRISPEQCHQALNTLSPELRQALETAAQRVRR